MRAAVLPHAPALLESVRRRRSAAVATVSEAAAAAGRELEGDLVLVSPHARSARVYEEPRGSLASFGVPDSPTGAPALDGLSEEIERSWSAGFERGEADHGVVVPLRLMGPGGRVVALGLPEWTGPGARPIAAAIAAGKGLAAVLGRIESLPPVVFSAHTSAALTPSAPLTERPEGRVLHDAIVTALKQDVSGLASIPAELWEQGGSCGAGPLTALGLLFEGPARVTAEEEPFGVGYVVAGLP